MQNPQFPVFLGTPGRGLRDILLYLPTREALPKQIELAWNQTGPFCRTVALKSPPIARPLVQSLGAYCTEWAWSLRASYVVVQT
eukprot:1156693-Pelagomonas_calceolata.AAC.4